VIDLCSRCLILCTACTLVLSLTTGVGCQGVSTAQAVQGPGSVFVSPHTMNFGDVTAGTTRSQTGTLTAATSNVRVSTADWSGQGYSVSDITFPLTIPAGKSVSFTVAFTPQAAGSSAGSISFFSDASDFPIIQTLTGAGIQPATHSVDLSWDPSTSTVAGYNIYRGTQSGGPYARLNSALLPSTSYSDASVQSGATYFYVTTAVDSSDLESAYSNQARAMIPSP